MYNSWTARHDIEAIYDDYLVYKTNLTNAMADSGFLNDKNETLNATYFASLNYHEFEHYADKIFAERWN